MKILHLFNVNKGTYFANLLINCINCSGLFDSATHYFCVRNRTYFNSIKFSNVFLDEDEGSIVYKYVNEYDYIFLHGLCFPEELNELPKQFLYKIIWRTWGGSSGLYSIKRKNLFLYWKDLFKKHRSLTVVKKMPFVCGANVIDLIDTLQKKKHFYEFPYPLKPSKICQPARNIKINQSNVNILVGHSAYKTDKHDAVLRKLSIIASEKIKIFVPLTYGVEDYKEKLISKWKSVFGDKISFITEPMSLSDYSNLISNMDLFFLVGDRSYALGNIEIALRNNINIVLSKKGVIRQGFLKDNIKHYIFEKICFDNILSFKKKCNSDISSSIVSDYDNDIKKLQIIFRHLEEDIYNEN